MRLLLLILMWGLCAEAASAQSRGGRGQQYVQQGLFDLAIVYLRPVVDKYPDDDLARASMGRALSALGKCEEALEHFDVLAERAYVDAMALRAESLCWLRLGAVSRARGVLEEAVDVDPDKAVIWGDLGAIAIRQQDERLLDEVLDRLHADPRGYWMAQALGASSALEWGHDDVDARIQVFLTAARDAVAISAQAQAAILDGLRWLDLNEPFFAEESFAEAIRATPRSLRPRLLRAEAVRRQGNPSQSLLILDGAVRSRGAKALLHVAVRARVLHDLGRTPQAEELLATVAGLDDPELDFTRWYIASQSERPMLERELTEHLTADGRSLSDLIALERP